MRKVPYKVRVHINGRGFNESFWVMVEKHCTMYNISTVWPKNGARVQESTVPDYQVVQEVLRLIGELYEKEEICQINLTWSYPQIEVT